MADEQIVIIGAGPAGLTAAYEMSRHGIAGIILEADNNVGGISRTEERDGYRFDLGGHRFFSKSQEVVDLWNEILPNDMLTRPRLSRIYYGGKFYDYPLKASNALKNMGLPTALSCMASYGMARLHPIPNPQSFEEWVTNEFGSKLYSMFFKAYTEKVWGIPCAEIGADWAAQRIKGLSMGAAIRSMFVGNKGGKIKTLIDEFRYPKYGPGQIWQACADAVVRKGWKLLKQTRLVGVRTEGGKVAGITVETADGSREDFPCTALLSSMPLRELVAAISPEPPAAVTSAAKELKYRDFLTVSLIIDAEQMFPDNWIYIHSPEVKLGRIQNFKNWSPYMVPDESKTCLGLEYFVNEGDGLWTAPDSGLVEMGYHELGVMGLSSGSLVGGHVVRVQKAYPVYDTGYIQRLETLKSWLTTMGGLYCIGRNGQHRYNNMDHSMMTALIAARNIALGESRNPWAVNEDAEYHEESEDDAA
jgi:protoporphyrinogen oxidase